MAIKEGRCPNCGSILNLDPAAEKGHCLFCDAVFDNKTAFEIAANPKDAEFPNLPQPKYEGPNLDPRSIGGSSGLASKSKQSQPAVKKAKAPAAAGYVHKEIKMPDMRLSKKTKIKALIITLVALAVIAAVSVPIVLQRNTTRARLVSEMSSVAPFSVNPEKDVAISQTSNSYLLIASPEAVDEADMIKLFKNYCEKRASIQDIDLDDFGRAYGKVTVKLVTPSGGYLIAEPGDMASIESGAAIVKLS